MIRARNIKKNEREELIEFKNRNKEKYVWDDEEYEDDQLVIENDHTHVGTPAEFPGIDINDEDDGPAIELLDDTNEDRVLVAAKETGISTRGMNIEGVTTAVDLIDDNSDSDDESEAPILEDPDSSDDEDSDDDDNDDAGGGAQAIHRTSVRENADSRRQERKG